MSIKLEKQRYLYLLDELRTADAPLIHFIAH